MTRQEMAEILAEGGYLRQQAGMRISTIATALGINKYTMYGWDEGKQPSGEYLSVAARYARVLRGPETPS